MRRGGGGMSDVSVAICDDARLMLAYENGGT